MTERRGREDCLPFCLRWGWGGVFPNRRGCAGGDRAQGVVKSAFKIVPAILALLPEERWWARVPYNKLYQIQVWEGDCRLEKSSQIHILYVAQGACRLGLEDKSVPLGKGEVFLLNFRQEA